jgi:hypothetical protein
MTRVHICEGSPNPLANKDPHRSIFASGYGLPGPYSLADLDRGVHFEGGGGGGRGGGGGGGGGSNLLGHQ